MDTDILVPIITSNLCWGRETFILKSQFHLYENHALYIKFQKKDKSRRKGFPITKWNSHSLIHAQLLINPTSVNHHQFSTRGTTDTFHTHNVHDPNYLMLMWTCYLPVFFIMRVFALRKDCTPFLAFNHSLMPAKCECKLVIYQSSQYFVCSHMKKTALHSSHSVMR